MAAAPGKIRVLHLLCKHTKSRNPVSRRTGGSTSSVSVDSAHTELQAIIGKLQTLSGQELVDAFAKEASGRSDCGSYAQGGDLGFFGPGEMQKPFEEASYALEVGKMSGIIDTDSGSHIILRIA
ncbi:PIN1 [Symbiodinium natans]|uniref:Peptidyl-prolyl cis-trans isomerase n=1 Tax=Symbiodinium natans TaxID=878477 RepID=A0A812LX91_9DINO|nr:PIN1 [Symbiodinium natans]